MKTQTIRSALITLAAGAALLGSVAAMSSPVMEARTIRVSYADLDLSRDVDQQRLEQRISRAAKQVCGPTSPRELAGSLRQALDNTECRARARADAIAASGLQFKNGRYSMMS